MRQSVDTLPRLESEPARRGAGIAALLGVLILLVGVPVALVAFVGNPLPTEAPTRDWLTAEVTAGLVIKVLGVLVWIVWVHFVVCLLTEWQAIRAGRMPGRVALGGGSQLLARKLIATVLLLSGGAVAAQGVTALAAESPTVATSSISAGTRQAESTLPTITGAEELKVSDAGQRETDRRGEPLKHYDVKPPQGRNYDTLWDISERTLGDPLRYKEVYELNKGRIQADGRRLTDADLIQPGWQLRLPSDAKGAGVRTTPGSSVPAPSTAIDSGGAASAGASTGAESVTNAEGSQGSTVAAVDETTKGISQLLLGGGLILAGIARALTARRGPFGEPDEDAGALALAASLRRSDFLDQALRGLSEMRSAQHEPMPVVHFVYAGEREVVLHLAGKTVAPESPWTVGEDGTSWRLAAEDLTEPGEGTAAPYPSLVTVAETHGFDLLVDLEMAPGLVSVGGDITVARESAMSMALDLATHAWSDSVDVVMVGFADRLSDLETQRVRHLTSLEEALSEAEGGQTRLNGVVNQLGLSGVLQGRQRGAATECSPLVVFISGPPTAEQAHRLARLTSGGRTSFSVVCVGDSPSARWRFVVDRQGGFDAGVLGISGTARRLSIAGHTQLLALLAAASERRESGVEVLETTPTTEVAELSRPVASVDTAPATAAGFEAASVRLRLLGPVTVEAPGYVEAARRELLTEVVAMAALHPEGVHTAVLQAGLWPRGVEEDVINARLRDVQDWLGHDESGEPRFRLDDKGRWRLHGVATDYGVLVGAGRTGGLVDLLAALRLGTGEAFSGGSRHYAWLAFAREARQCRLLVASVAQRAADLATAQADAAQAFDALRLGVALVPTAESLWRTLLRITSRHDPERLGAEIAEMYSVLTEHGVRPEPETDALVNELAPGEVGSVGS